MIRTSTIRKVVLAGTLLVFPTVMPTVSAFVPLLQQSAGEQLTVALKKIEKATGYRISYAQNDLKNLKAQGATSSKDIHKALEAVIGNLPLAYSIEGKFVTIYPIKNKSTNSKAEVKTTTLSTVTLRGMVVDENGDCLPGVSVKAEYEDSDSHCQRWLVHAFAATRQDDKAAVLICGNERGKLCFQRQAQHRQSCHYHER